MIDHVTLGVSHLDDSRHFFEHALRPLGLRIVLDRSELLGFADDDQPFFFLSLREPTHRVHVAFSANDRAAVDAFHKAAQHAGGVDNGPPGLRPEYHDDYYAAYVFDPDGNNIEAVFRGPA